MCRTPGQQPLIRTDPNMTCKEETWPWKSTCVHVLLWNIIIQRWQSFLFRRGNPSSFSISKIRYYPCHQCIWNPKLMIFLQFAVLNTFTLGSQQNSTSAVCYSSYDIWRWSLQHALIHLFLSVTISHSACFSHKIFLGFMKKVIPWLSQFNNTDFIIVRILRLIVLLNEYCDA